MSSIPSISASSDKPLKGENIAILVASGFNEQDMSESVRALADTGAKITLLSTDAGLVQGWTGSGWGHYHAVETPLSAALAADFSMLLVPGGQRSLDKLKTSAHTTRFVKGFVAYGNPIAFFGDAVQLLSHVGAAGGKVVTGPSTFEQTLVSAGATWSNDTFVVSDNVLTGQGGTDQIKGLVIATVAHFMNIPAELRMAA